MTTTVGVADTYWNDSLYNPGGTLLRDIDRRNIVEGDPREPLKFKAYRGCRRWQLPPAALRLQPGEPVAAEAVSAAEPLDEASVSTLLYHAYGFCRHDLEPGAWPYHRTVPSARCFFPAELYLALPASGVRPAGVFYYDPMHHALVQLRDGDYRELIGDALGADLGGTAGVVLVTALFWKAAFRYRDYAYRLATQEAGMVAGSVYLVAAALGLQAPQHHLFSDDLLNRLLGVDGEEETTLIALPLGRDAQAPARRPHPPSTATLPAVPAFRSTVRQSPGYHPGVVPILAEMNRAAFMTEVPAQLTDSDLAHPEPTHAGTTAPGLSLPVPRADDPGPIESARRSDLGSVLRGRTSGPAFIDYMDQPVSAEVVWDLARGVARPMPCDLTSIDGPPPQDCYLVIQRVDGIPAGVYRVRRDGTALDRLSEDPVGPVLRSVAVGPSVARLAHAAFTVFLAVPRDLATQVYGARGYRILNQAAGAEAMRVCFLAARHDLVARVHNGYSAQQIEEALQLRNTGDVVVFQIGVGITRPGPELQLPVVF